ncbi:MAG: TRAP transporter small permease subunit [Cellvibrionales bacterium]|nr:TRAP transporter small permease subunit [Cellvibrionales bacterium]
MLFINNVSRIIGILAAWQLFAMLLLTVVIVVLRYAFGIGSIALQELTLFFHANAFLLGLCYTLSCDGHVRVDIFYQKMTTYQKHWANAIGALVFLIPFCLFLLITTANFFYDAWLIKEQSPEPDGLSFYYLFKGVLPLSVFFLLLQGIALFFQHAIPLVYKPKADQ